MPLGLSSGTQTPKNCASRLGLFLSSGFPGARRWQRCIRDRLSGIPTGVWEHPLCVSGEFRRSMDHGVGHSRSLSSPPSACSSGCIDQFAREVGRIAFESARGSASGCCSSKTWWISRSRFPPSRSWPPRCSGPSTSNVAPTKDKRRVRRRSRVPERRRQRRTFLRSHTTSGARLGALADGGSCLGLAATFGRHHVDAERSEMQADYQRPAPRRPDCLRRDFERLASDHVASSRRTLLSPARSHCRTPYEGRNPMPWIGLPSNAIR